MREVGIIGSGGQADEIESYLGRPSLFRAVDKEFAVGELVDVSDPTEEQKATPIVVAVGAPLIRKELVGRWKGSSFDTLVVADKVDSSLVIGKGSIIAPGCIVTTNVFVGNHTLVNIGVTLSHNTRVGDYVTISPGVNIAGNVQIGDGVFIGIGATISNGVTLASGVVVGAGAVVLKSIEEENSVHAGVPASKIGQNESWLREI